MQVVVVESGGGEKGTVPILQTNQPTKHKTNVFKQEKEKEGKTKCIIEEGRVVRVWGWTLVDVLITVTTPQYHFTTQNTTI